jgi:dTDP-4-dehydrorhamnose 3,5-epimerase
VLRGDTISGRKNSALARTDLAGGLARPNQHVNPTPVSRRIAENLVTNPFQFRRLPVPEVVLIETSAVSDTRGFFVETYKRSEFSASGVSANFVQDNWSHSARGVLRGLHYQKQPRAQGKLVTVARGMIFDVAVDIRKGSPTYGRWVGEVLSSDNLRLLYIPVGFAHGFCVLSEEADVVYKVTAEYAPELERGILWSDQKIGIGWPTREPILSTRDATLPLLEDADNDFVME